MLKTGGTYCLNLSAPFIVQVPPFRAVLEKTLPCCALTHRLNFLSQEATNGAPGIATRTERSGATKEGAPGRTTRSKNATRNKKLPSPSRPENSISQISAEPGPPSWSNKPGHEGTSLVGITLSLANAQRKQNLWYGCSQKSKHVWLPNFRIRGSFFSEHQKKSSENRRDRFDLRRLPLRQRDGGPGLRGGRWLGHPGAEGRTRPARLVRWTFWEE